MAEVLSSQGSSVGTVLVVEDDPDVLASARLLLERNGWRMLAARSPVEAWSTLAGEAVDLILLDLNFTPNAASGEEGLRWLAEIRAHDPSATVIVVTAHSGVKVAVEAMKAGASDFVMKPWSNGRLLETLNDGLRLARARRGGAPAEAAERPDEEPLLGDSAAMRSVRERLTRAAASEAAVLICGPAGSGKSLAARWLHARSGRAASPFTPLDLRGIEDADWAGLFARAFAEAAGGTLFLDEIAALPRAGQAELLRRLEAGADVRLVSASRETRESLTELRDDLADRLAVIEVHLPPLAERGEDAVLLAEHFVRLFFRRAGRAPKPLDAGALELLRGGGLPGEVRGLRQAAERATALSEGELIGAADLLPAARTAAGQAAEDLNLARSEKAIVEAALKRHAHNVSSAAKALGLTRAALYRRMMKHGL